VCSFAQSRVLPALLPARRPFIFRLMKRGIALRSLILTVAIAGAAFPNPIVFNSASNSANPASDAPDSGDPGSGGSDTAILPVAGIKDFDAIQAAVARSLDPHNLADAARYLSPQGTAFTVSVELAFPSSAGWQNPGFSQFLLANVWAYSLDFTGIDASPRLAAELTQRITSTLPESIENSEYNLKSIEFLQPVSVLEAFPDPPDPPPIGSPEPGSFFPVCLGLAFLSLAVLVARGRKPARRAARAFLMAD